MLVFVGTVDAVYKLFNVLAVEITNIREEVIAVAF